MSPSTSASGDRAAGRAPPCAARAASPENARCAAWRSHAATTRTSRSRPRRTTVSSGGGAERLGELLAVVDHDHERPGRVAPRALLDRLRELERRRLARLGTARDRAPAAELGERAAARREQAELGRGGRAAQRVGERRERGRAAAPVRPDDEEVAVGEVDRDRLELGVAEAERRRRAAAPGRAGSTAATPRRHRLDRPRAPLAVARRAARRRAARERQQPAPRPPGRRPRPRRGARARSAGSRARPAAGRPRTTLSGTPSEANSSSSAMRSTIFAGTIPASAFGTAPRRSAVIAKCTPSGAPVADEPRQRVDERARGRRARTRRRSRRSRRAGRRSAAARSSGAARLYSASVKAPRRREQLLARCSTVRRSEREQPRDALLVLARDDRAALRQRLEHAQPARRRSRARRG